MWQVSVSTRFRPDVPTFVFSTAQAAEWCAARERCLDPGALVVVLSPEYLAWLFG